MDVPGLSDGELYTACEEAFALVGMMRGGQNGDFVNVDTRLATYGLLHLLMAALKQIDIDGGDSAAFLERARQVWLSLGT